MSSEQPLARPLATWFGCGESPIAPGTVGTLGALPLYLVLKRLNPPMYWGAVAIVTAAGIWAAEHVSEQLGEEDPQCVVIDEVAGVLLALGLVRGRSWRAKALAVCLFRLLDVVKPGPVKLAERARPAGVGIVLDDLVAGLCAGLLSRWG